MIIIILLVLLMVLAISCCYLERRIPNFPPGPIGLPLLGHLPLLGTHPHKTLWKWRGTYGPLIGVWFGYYRTVVINDAKLIREALNMGVFSGRPKLNFFTARNDDGIVRGIAVTDGSHWAEQRRFTLRNLRDFGVGTKTMEAKVQEEIHEFIDHLRAKEGKPVQVKHLFNNTVLNALWSIMFSDRISEDDPESLVAVRSLSAIADDGSFLGSLAIFLPWFAQIAPKLSGFDKIIRSFACVKKFLRRQIESHNKYYIQNQPRDFVDAYKDEVERTTDPNSSFHAKNDVMVQTLMDLFGAGAETTSTTLTWLCAYLICHLEVQKKLQDENDEVVGQERVPSLADRSSMPFTEAVINEVMRFSSLLPFAVTHSTTEDVEFHGYFIPKGTMIIPNIYGVHFDQNVWGDPENFRPERFLDSLGKFQKNENVLPFSTGKRACIGEGLARDELFLFTTTLFQTFSVSAAGNLPSLEPHMGFTLSPHPFEMILKTRIK